MAESNTDYEQSATSSSVPIVLITPERIMKESMTETELLREALKAAVTDGEDDLVTDLLERNADPTFQVRISKPSPIVVCIGPRPSPV